MVTVARSCWHHDPLGRRVDVLLDHNVGSLLMLWPKAVKPVELPLAERLGVMHKAALSHWALRDEKAGSIRWIFLVPSI